MNNRLMLESYFNRINNENVQKELLKFGISSYDRQGNKIDSLKLLDSIMLILDELSDNEQGAEFYYLVTLIVGSYYANRFIDTFFYEKLW